MKSLPTRLGAASPPPRVCPWQDPHSGRRALRHAWPALACRPPSHTDRVWVLPEPRCFPGRTASVGRATCDVARLIAHSPQEAPRCNNNYGSTVGCRSGQDSRYYQRGLPRPANGRRTAAPRRRPGEPIEVRHNGRQMPTSGVCALCERRHSRPHASRASGPTVAGVAVISLATAE